MSVSDSKQHLVKDFLLDEGYPFHIGADGEEQVWPHHRYGTATVEAGRQVLMTLRSGFEDEGDVESEALDLWVRIANSIAGNANNQQE
jgi:hypothetical protein